MKSGKLIFLISALLCSINLVAQKMEVKDKVMDGLSTPVIGKGNDQWPGDDSQIKIRDIQNK